MEGNSPYITNLVNSIIGVSVLAMPFCLKQCGIILGLGLLFCAAWLTYLSCSMLASSAFHKRKRTYEYLALCTLGPTGKFTVELSMIGLMLGTCVAFYVVIGDLSNGILSRFIDGADVHTLRVFTIVFCALCIALPLGMMKNLSIISYFGFFSLMFYLAFLVVVILNAVSNGLLRLDWWDKVNLFRPAGVFQCLPIFSLAYACQCQLFIVYSSLEDPSVRRVEDIVSGAIKFVTLVYMSVGFFGYTTYQEEIAGNLLVSFPSNYLLDIIKLGFAMSVVLGFPLMISPCRQSIHTLFFAKPAGEGLQQQTYIPPFLFKSITLTIVLSTMIIAIVIPNVETILGLTGATMGSIICFIFPALIYEKAASKGPGAIPKFVFCLGCVLLVICTYTNLQNSMKPTDPDHPVVKMDQKPPEVDLHEIEKEPDNIENENKAEGKEEEPDPVEDKDKPKPIAEVVDNEHRHEPANPVENDDGPVEKQVHESQQEVDKDDAGAGDIQEPENRDEDVGKQQPPSLNEAERQPSVNEREEKENAELSEARDSHEHAKLEDKAAIPDPHVNLEDKNDVRESLEKHHIQSPLGDRTEERIIGKEHLAEAISPKIIKKDEDRVGPGLKQQDIHPQVAAVQSRVPDSDVHKQGHVFEVDKAPAAAKEENAPVHNSPEEKELLEKIKIQHDKQQQLLKEQEQLIKKLEEHQDKKEQAAEEKRVDALNNEVEVRKERDLQAPKSEDDLAKEDPIDVALPQKHDLLGEVKGIDSKVEIPEAKVMVGDALLPGRELLSDQNGMDAVSQDSESQKILDLEGKEKDNIMAPEEKADFLGNEAEVLQNSDFGRSNGGEVERKVLENTFLKQDEPYKKVEQNEDSQDTAETGQHQGRRVERSLDDEESLEVDDVGEDQDLSKDARDIGEDSVHNALLKQPDKNSMDESPLNIGDGGGKDDIGKGLKVMPDPLQVESVIEEQEGVAVKCVEDDLSCWQGKSKSRELKSLERSVL